MKRTVLYALAAFSLIVFGWLAYTNAITPTPEPLPDAMTLRLDGGVGVAGFAVIDTVGLVQAPDGMYYDMALRLDPEELEYIRRKRLYVAGFKPLIETEWQDSLGRAPVLAGTWIYYPEETPPK